MIVYKKLEKLLQDRNMQWKSLCDAGISVNMPAKFSKNKPMNTDIINKVCEYLQVQPSEIMEWIPDEEYNKANEEIASIDQQIAELQAKKKKLQNKQNTPKSKISILSIDKVLFLYPKLKKKGWLITLKK